MVNTVGSLTQFQKSLIIGTILGDGYLRIIPGRKNAFLEINHSFSQKEYVDWKFEKLKGICNSAPKQREGNGGRVAYRFYTKQHPELTGIYNTFYKNGKKIIPDNFYLNTQQFTMENQVKLLEYLNKLDLKASLNKDKDYYRIRFISSSIDKLKELVGQNIVPSMYYKI